MKNQVVLRKIKAVWEPLDEGMSRKERGAALIIITLLIVLASGLFLIAERMTP